MTLADREAGNCDVGPVVWDSAMDDEGLGINTHRGPRYLDADIITAT